MQMILDAYKICQKVLVNAPKLEIKTRVRNPTRKEQMKHVKLIEKQRRKSMGEQ